MFPDRKVRNPVLMRMQFAHAHAILRICQIGPDHINLSCYGCGLRMLKTRLRLCAVWFEHMQLAHSFNGIFILHIDRVKR